MPSIDELINKAISDGHGHDACFDCGKHCDGLMTCYAPDDSGTVQLCPDCMDDSGYCYCCGHFFAGHEQFDIGPWKGYCDTCREELLADFDNYDDDELYPSPDDETA